MFLGTPWRAMMAPEEKQPAKIEVWWW